LAISKDDLLMATDELASAGHQVNMGNNCSIFLEADGTAEAERLFAALREGGKAEMELAQTPWAERYGSCTDRFAVVWMVNYTENVQFGN
jgi:PhnB protein